MVVKASDVIGLKVLSINNGKIVAKVRDIIYSPAQKKVLAFLVDEGGWFSDAEVVAMSDVANIGEDAVMIASESVVKQAGDVEGDLYNIRDGEEHLTQVPVITEDGDALGKATDIFFDPVSGTVDELEVSQGLVENIKGGKKRIRVEDIITVGEDALVVSTFAEVDADIQQEEQGIAGVLNRTKQNAAEAYIKAREESRKMYAKAKSGTAQPASAAKRAAGDSEQDSRLQQTAIKARLKAAEAGQKLENKADDLRAIAASGDMEHDLKEKSGQAKDYLKDKYQQSMSYIEDKRKESAVGQYITTNVLTLNDDMVARRGDLVTNDLLRRAEKEGVLDKVLTNTSKDPVR